MENIDALVLRKLAQWRAQGQRALLATVVGTWGSSPRPVGSIMALCEDGAVVGSVSGGCIEDDLIARYCRSAAAGSACAPTLAATPDPIVDGPPLRCSYGVDADQAHRFGLPCGGTLELVLEFNPDAQLLTELMRQLDAGRSVARQLRLADGAVTLLASRPAQALQCGPDTLTNTFGPKHRILLIGAGQLSEYVATMALFCGFEVTVCDPREEYRGAWSVAGAALVTSMPDDAVLAFNPDQNSYVVALTHDPKLDDLALLAALEGEAFYVGALGSTRSNQTRRERLREHFGLRDDQLARLHGPIGIAIGSKTPPEIAVSVMAEILAVKNRAAATQAPAQRAASPAACQRP